MREAEAGKLEPTPRLKRRVVAEFMGTLALVAVVVGSGVMAERLAGGNGAVALLANTAATGAGLVAIILAVGPVSGGHLNPAVSVADAVLHGVSWRVAAAYVAAQVSGGVCGVMLAHAMFGLPLLQSSSHMRRAGRRS